MYIFSFIKLAIIAVLISICQAIAIPLQRYSKSTVGYLGINDDFSCICKGLKGDKGVKCWLSDCRYVNEIHDPYTTPLLEEKPMFETHLENDWGWSDPCKNKVISKGLYGNKRVYYFQNNMCLTKYGWTSCRRV